MTAQTIFGTRRRDAVPIRHKGFTIIQIVIAMLIFAILTSIAFLGASIYITQSNETKVKSDLSALEVALHDYMLSDAAACVGGKLTLNGANRYLTQENAVKTSDLSGEVTVDESKNDCTGVSTLLDPWGHEYRILILNDRDRKSGDNEYGAKGKNRAFIYAYTAGKDGKAGEEDTRQDDAVLCVQYSDGEVYSKIYLPSDGSNQSIKAPAYTYWNKDENGKHSVMKEDIFAVGTVDPAKAPGKENGGGNLSKNPIPDGGIYIIGINTEGETVLEGGRGDTFPKKPQTGDVYFQDIGERRFAYTYNRGGAYGTEWSVASASDAYSYDDIEILTKIVGKPVTSMYKAFENQGLVAAPKIPSSITNMDEAFSGCQQLEKAPVIPSSVTSMNGTFRNCWSLTTAPVIPSSVKDMTSTFEYCDRLTGVVEINANPTSYENCFSGTRERIALKGSSSMLKELTSATACATGNNVVVLYTGPNELIPVGCTYKGTCGDGVSAAFPDAPSVGDWYLDENNGYYYEYGKGVVTSSDGHEYDYGTEWSVRTEFNGISGPIDQSKWFGEIRSEIAGKPVTNMCNAFNTEYQNNDYLIDQLGCNPFDSLTKAPAIPSTVTNMSYAFFGCTALTEAPTIPNGVKNMSYTFAGCSALTVAPTIPGSVTDMSYTFSGCTALKTVEAIPSSVTNMDKTFVGCTALTGEIQFNANPVSYDMCFYDTAKPIKLSGTSKILNELARYYNNITVAG